MYLALDTETTGLGYWDTAFCISWAWRDGEIHSGVEYDFTPLEWRDTYEGLVFHNAKFDVQKLVQAGVLPSVLDWTCIHDTEAMSHLLNEQQPKALKRLAKEILGLETDEQEALRAARRKLGLTKADGYDALPREVLEPYARKDAEYTLLLFEHFWPQIQEDEVLLRLYREEQELMGVLYEMEGRGLGTDMQYVNYEAKHLAGEILEADLWLRDEAGEGSWTEKGQEFNYGSWQQLLEVLQGRGHKVDSTKKEVLEQLNDEFASRLLALRKGKKVYDYFRAIQTEVGPDGILHPNFKQWGTRGRRFSSGSEDDS